MGNVKGFFSGNYLKAENLKGGEIIEILAMGEVAEIQNKDGKTKSVLNYRVSVDGKEFEWTPNKTNGQQLMEAWGEDDEKWVGKKFQVEIVKTISFGKPAKAMIINIIDEKAGNGKAPKK